MLAVEIRCGPQNQKQSKFWFICSSHSSIGAGSVQAISLVHHGQKLSGLSGFRVMPAGAPSLTACLHACRFSADQVPGGGQPSLCHSPGLVSSQMRQEW